MGEYVSVKRVPAEEDKRMLKEGLELAKQNLPYYMMANFRGRGSKGIRYMTPNEYEWALKKKDSSLGGLASQEAAEIIKYGLDQLPTSGEPLEVRLADAVFMGLRDPVQVVYQVDSPEVLLERSRLIDIIQSLSGVQVGRATFVPHLKMASIERVVAGKRAIDAFKEVMPSVVKLEPITVEVLNLG